MACTVFSLWTLLRHSAQCFFVTFVLIIPVEFHIMYLMFFCPLSCASVFLIVEYAWFEMSYIMFYGCPDLLVAPLEHHIWATRPGVGAAFVRRRWFIQERWESGQVRDGMQDDIAVTACFRVATINNWLLAYTSTLHWNWIFHITGFQTCWCVCCDSFTKLRYLTPKQRHIICA